MPTTSLTSTASIEISVLFLAVAVVFIIGMLIAFSYPAIEREQSDKSKLKNYKVNRSRSLYSDTSDLYCDDIDNHDRHDRHDSHDHHGSFFDVD